MREVTDRGTSERISKGLQMRRCTIHASIPEKIEHVHRTMASVIEGTIF